ncbi:hypothetical protein ACFE04_015603 [Oxalis oulophora]
MGKAQPESSSSSTSSESTSSTSITETINGSHEFKIKGYSLTKGIGIGKYITSETFMVGGYLWAVYFYPDAVMQTDGFEYLKESCPSILTELLAYVASESEHGNDALLDGSDANGRRVKQRL